MQAACNTRMLTLAVCTLRLGHGPLYHVHASAGHCDTRWYLHDQALHMHVQCRLVSSSTETE
jgi:hypothetical protein